MISVAVVLAFLVFNVMARNGDSDLLIERRPIEFVSFPAGDNLSKDFFGPFKDAIYHQKVVSYTDTEKTAVFL